MAFIKKKISNYGTSNPIMARTSVQVQGLMQAYGLGRETDEAVFLIYMAQIQPRLIRCMEIADRISAEVEREIKEFDDRGVKTQSHGRVIELPHITQLTEDVETFLYNAKSSLRDTARVFLPLFGKEFDHSRYDKIHEWAIKEFGGDSPLANLLAVYLDWIEKIVRRRNAVEHPGGHSGHLHVLNFEFEGDDPSVGMTPPCWHRNDEPKSILHRDLHGILDNLLRFSEDILAVSLMQKGSRFPFVIYEVPEQERDPQAPIRLKVTVDMSKVQPSQGMSVDEK